MSNSAFSMLPLILWKKSRFHMMITIWNCKFAKEMMSNSENMHWVWNKRYYNFYNHWLSWYHISKVLCTLSYWAGLMNNSMTNAVIWRATQKILHWNLDNYLCPLYNLCFWWLNYIRQAMSFLRQCFISSDTFLSISLYLNVHKLSLKNDIVCNKPKICRKYPRWWS